MAAKLRCTFSEFHKFIGPRIKNSINLLTKKSRTRLNNICPKCKKRNVIIESAHIKGKERKKIVEKILKKYLKNKDKDIVEIELKEVEREILEAHKPMNKYFKFLCRKCHTEYDSRK